MKKRIVTVSFITCFILFFSCICCINYARAETKTFKYTIIKGDSLYRLAQIFDTTVSNMISGNPGIVPDRLGIGTVINIVPGSDVSVYFVKRGDTIGKIAAMYKTTNQVIAKWNDIANPDLIYEGEVLAIPKSYRFPGEFERQQSIWMQWPSEVYNQSSRPVAPAMINIIKAAAAYERVNVITRSNTESAQVKNMLASSGYSGSNVSFFAVDHYSIWARDVGPIFIKDNENRLNIANFGFNNYSRGGSQLYIHTEGQVDKQTAQLLGLPVIDSDLISEGGAIESNGKGTLMTTESVVLKRNPGMTKVQIENEYKRVLGIKKMVWLKKGLAEDDNITSGHINEIARFASPNTVLLAQILPGDRYSSWASQESYKRLEENYAILKNATDQDGKPFNIIRIPMPPGLYAESGNSNSIPVRTYLNYAVVNGGVIIQTYWKSGRSNALKNTENGVKDIFKRVFPGRDIIGIDSENINKWGGGIHCITQHMPAY